MFKFGVRRKTRYLDSITFGQHISQKYYDKYLGFQTYLDGIYTANNKALDVRKWPEEGLTNVTMTGHYCLFTTQSDPTHVLNFLSDYFEGITFFYQL